MRSLMAGMLAVVMMAGPATVRAYDAADYDYGYGPGEEQPRRITTQGEEMGLAFTSAVTNIFYFPAKFVVAGVGLITGGFAGWLTGGDQRSAYAFWVPSAGGDYFIRPEQAAGNEPIEFFGSTYSDQPSQYLYYHENSAYDSLYSEGPSDEVDDTY